VAVSEARIFIQRLEAGRKTERLEVGDLSEACKLGECPRLGPILISLKLPINGCLYSPSRPVTKTNDL
jgi:hypothetical protein